MSDHHPVELPGGDLKSARVANLAPDTGDEIHTERRRRSRRPHLLRGCLRHSDLPFQI